MESTQGGTMSDRIAAFARKRWEAGSRRRQIAVVDRKLKLRKEGGFLLSQVVIFSIAVFFAWMGWGVAAGAIIMPLFIFGIGLYLLCRVAGRAIRARISTYFGRARR